METTRGALKTSLLLRKIFIAGVVGSWLLAIWLASSSGFLMGWSRLKDGMSQNEVQQALGTPTSVGTSGCIGAGNQPVLRWEYKKWRSTYYVDFDYIGPGGAPAVFRTERFTAEWQCPEWWPWPRAKARA